MAFRARKAFGTFEKWTPGLCCEELSIQPSIITVVRLRKNGGKVLLLLCIGPTNFQFARLSPCLLTLLDAKESTQDKSQSGFQMTVGKSYINTKVITLSNQNGSKQRDQLIRIPSNYLKLSQSAGKIVLSRSDWLWFCFSLVKKLARNI